MSVTILTDYLPTLRRGDAGAHVALLQRLLTLSGHDPGPVDGKFGPRTEGAVRAYQQRYALAVDGVADPQTWGRLGQPVHITETAGSGVHVTDHFRLGEFPCPHCGRLVLLYLPDLCAVLEAVRAKVGGVPLAITSGYRCPDHNKAVGGSPQSQHLLGKAADIVSSVDPERVADAAEEVLVNRGGVLRYRRQRFTHVDIRPGRARGYMS